MFRVLWNSRSALLANQEKMDAISNNMANSQTDGYKRVDTSFQDLVGESLDRLGYPTSKESIGKDINSTGTGVRSTVLTRDNTQGDLTETDNSTDFAIDGEGYFKLTSPNNQAVYSRVGEFQIDGSGRLTDSNGNILNINFDKGYNQNNVKFEKNNFNVTEDGKIMMKINGEQKEVGKIQLYNAVGDNSFVSVGSNLYVPDKNAKVVMTTNASVKQGFKENSNVDIGSEMAEMIVTQRAFELASKGIQTADQMWGIANNLRSK